MHIPMEIILAIIGGAFGSTGLWQLIQMAINKHSAQRAMILGIGYDRLCHQCRKYIEEGHIPVEDLEDLEKYLYAPYRKMGGNGTAEMLFEKVKKLPNEVKS